jgi:hypothetical protein
VEAMWAISLHSPCSCLKNERVEMRGPNCATLLS